MRFGSLGRAYGKLGAPPKAGTGGFSISLSGTLSIAEDASVGDVVGTFSITGTVAGNWLDPITYTVTDTAGGLFVEDGDDLEVDGALDYETSTSHSITVEADNGTDAPISQEFTITIIDVPGPTMTSSATGDVAETDTLLFTLTADEAATFAITGGVDAAEFEISGSTLRWASNGSQDYGSPADTDTNNTYIVEVTATSTGTGEVGDPQSITITVTELDIGLATPTIAITLADDPEEDLTVETATPGFEITSTEDFIEDDIIYVRIDGVEADLGGTDGGHDITAGEDTADLFETVLSLASGANEIEVRHRRGSVVSLWSDPITVTVSISGADDILLEIGDHLLLESGDLMLIEA
jgi:hypothetical protein